MRNQAKSGYTLPFTVVMLVVIGLLSFSLYGMVRNERIEAARRYGSIQASLELESGVNYAFHRMQHNGRPWLTDSLAHASANGKIRFSLTQEQDGAFAKLTVYNHDSSRTFSARTGFNIPSSPALVMLTPQANISLAGNARIEGGTAVRTGSISYSTHYKMHAERDAFFDTVYVGENLPYFDTLSVYPELGMDQFTTEFTNDLCIFDGTDMVGNGTPVRCKTVVMQGDSRCLSCRIDADKVTLRGRATLENADIRSRNILMKDTVMVSGTFFAQETLQVSLERKQEKNLRLIVQGRKTGEVDYAGALNIDKLKASDVAVLFIGHNWSETFRGIPVNIAEDVELRGALISFGITDFRGKLTGRAIAMHFGFYEGETLWRGFLRGGQIIGDTAIHTFVPHIIYLGGEASYEKI